jgi:hypothetical protein
MLTLLCLTGALAAVSPRPALSAQNFPAQQALLLENEPAESQVNIAIPEAAQLEAPNAPCAGGPVIDGVTLDECFDQTFTVGGTSKTVRVWYTNVQSTVQRTVDGTTYNLTHWVNNDTEPQDVAQWAQEAWESYWDIFGHHPYDNGCGNRINVQLEDGVGWAGIAYWADPGSCWIGIDSPTVRAGNAQNVVYHEFQHYLQYSYDAGCYGFLRPNYLSGSAAGDAEFVEGYADLAMDAVDATVDNSLYSNFVNSYNPLGSFYDKNYWDVFNKYFSEQLGTQWNPTDPEYHMDAVREHYEECDVRDTLYVLDTLVPSLKPGMSEQKLFLNFFAANWAKDWADPAAQPELVYVDDDAGPSYGSVVLYKDENISSGSKSWAGETTPDDWAARYYQVKPQSTCSYVTVNVNGSGGANLGINLMAADTTAPTSVQRSAWIGEDFVRTFAGYGVHNRIAGIVNSFATNHTYDISFTCVTPVLDILEPRQTNYALVGDPASPIAFLARFKITSGGSPVLGLVESQVSADAEGDAITIVPGSFSQVGEEYWAILLPPVKPAGTTFVDLRICLDGSICDTETNALLYVNPGNTDFAMVFDGSGSMAWEDVIGEGTRLENAKKAGTVMADLLRVGDRVLVTDFSAFNNPPGCGLPGGSGNCPLDIITRLSRTDVTAPAAAAIASTKTAINNLTARQWTPIGGALQDAKNKLVAGPANTNPKHIILLSDGDENVNPLYAAVKDEIVASGVVVDTIRFSNDAPGALLAQIAADTGGSYTYVPTTGGTLESALQARQQIADQLTSLGAPQNEIDRITADLLPGPLGLDNVYDLYETKGQGAARLFHVNNLFVPDNTWEVASQHVDPSVNTLRFVVAGKQDDDNYCGGYVREVEIAQPTTLPRPIWIPVSPPNPQNLPPNWDIRHSAYDDVVIIPNPIPGTWQIRTRYVFYGPCAEGEMQGATGVEDPTAFESDFMMNASAETNIQLTARFLLPAVNNQANAGDTIPVVATLLDRNGAIPGAQFFGLMGVILGIVEKPGGAELIILFDDGMHDDGNANDGVYGGAYAHTSFGGTYNVRLFAFLEDAANPGQFLSREWNGSFWINGPDINDGDKDGMPDPWERRCKLNTQADDSQGDLDHDGLTNLEEFHQGTLPCRADTDKGGERDGSEVSGGRNPLFAPDDLVRPLGHISINALNAMIRVQWTYPISYTNMVGWISTVPGELGQPVGMGSSGIYTFTGVTNDLGYFVTLNGENGTAEGDYSEPELVTPKADPDAPSGTMVINNGAQYTSNKDVMLNLSSSDTPLPGAAQSANAHLGGPLALKYNEVSGNIEVRISNDPTFAGVVWVPLVVDVPWVLGPGGKGIYTVFAQFRDGAGNESFVVIDTIEYLAPVYLPLIRYE